MLKPKPGTVAFEADPVGDDAVKETLQCDLLVIGAGIGGLSATASALQNGLSVVLLEKGTTYAAHGSEIGAIGGKVLTEAGLVPDPIDVYNEAMEAAQYRCDGTVWQRYIDRSGEAIDWLEDTVIQGACGGQSPSSAADRIANGVNWRATTVQWEAGFDSVIKQMLQYCQDNGADVRFETPAVQLVKDGERIVGAIAKTKDGEYIKVEAAKGTLLATGSYDYNPELMSERIRPRDLRVYAYLNTSFTNTGDGHLMGLAAGAAQDEYPQVVMNDSSGSRSGGAYSAAVLSVLRVNDDGVRFVNEDLTLNYLSNAINYQHQAHDWCICDANIGPMAQRMMGDAPFAPDDMVNGFIADSVECASVAEVAKTIGCEEAVIQATLDRYNEMCDKGVDEDFNKNPHNMVRVDTPPYYVFDEGSALLTTVSGLRTNDKSEVLDGEGAPLGGLYATGNVSGSMFYDSYPHHIAGVSTGRCVTFGYLLGRRLAGIEE
ncbi:FAD-dependent oxidoreductase [Arabiibacter massiliensis]|uniref:FAD-dependent oxidoreductase n=1 Tax=Arabiibacter massiliensis TaxID=1870985 RepID=UPI00155AE4AE|nr:FAD-dependent oxidoreductase [Arabiibacter massiliensis]